MPKPNVVFFLNQFFAQVGLWSLKNRWLVFSACLLVLAGSVYFASKVRMNNSFDAYFNEDDVSYSAYLKYRKDFGSDEIAFVLYDASDFEHGVFNLALMQKIALLSARLENELPFVKEVKSIANVEVLLPFEDGIEIIKLTEDFPQDQQGLLDFAEKFMTKKMYIDGFVSSDRNFGAIQIDMAKSSVDPLEEIRLDPTAGDTLNNLYPQASDIVLNRILEETQFQDIPFYVSGDVPLNSAFNNIAMADMALTMSLAFIIVTLLLLFFFKGSIVGSVGPLAVVILSIVITLGFLGVLGWDMDLMFSLVPTLLIAIGVAQSVHIISEFRIHYALTQNRALAIQETLHLVGAPCLLTSLTTAAGFLAMSISPIKTISHMAIYTGLAVLAAFFLSITLLTFFLSFGKNKSGQQLVKNNSNPLLEKILIGIARFTIRYPKRILVIAFLVFAVAGAGISKVVVDSNFLLDFDKNEPIRITTEYIDNTMGGMGSLVYLFETEEPDAIKNPEVLKEIERFQDYLNSKTPLVQKTYSIVDLLKDINQSFHNDDPAYYQIPESRDLVAQYLLVYELSGGDEISNFISSDYARATIEVRTQLAASSAMASLQNELDAYLSTQPLQHSTLQATGMGALWIQLMDYITESQLKGVALAFVVIALLMCFIFRSVPVGLISMIPNVAPALLTVGFIGWIGVHLDYTKLLVAPIAIGIAVDDTIHLLTRYHNEFVKRRNYEEALIAAMSNVGRALLITSIILILGFSMLGFATLESQAWFGILLTLTVLVALIADFFVMPALILVFKPFGPEHPKTAAANA